MRNPNRTTKRERRDAKQWNALAARTFGIAEAARYMRDGVLLDEATSLDRLMSAIDPWANYRISQAAEAALAEAAVDVVVYGEPMTDAMLDAAGKVADALTERVLRPELERLGIDSADYRYEYDTSAAAPVGAPPFDTIRYDDQGANPHMHYPFEPHISFSASIPYRNGKRHVDGLAEAWRQYRERHDPADYADWDGDPWHDPNERDAARAEAIEHALANDYDEDDHDV